MLEKIHIISRRQLSPTHLGLRQPLKSDEHRGKHLERRGALEQGGIGGDAVAMETAAAAGRKPTASPVRRDAPHPSRARSGRGLGSGSACSVSHVLGTELK